MFAGVGPNVIGDVIAGGALTVLSGTIILIFKRLPREVGQLSRDWYGQPARPGFPEVPGVPQRIEKVETSIAEMRDFVISIDHEIHPNSGESIKDKVDKTESEMAELRGDVTKIHKILKDGASNAG